MTGLCWDTPCSIPDDEALPLQRPTHRPAPQRLAGLPAPDRGPLGRGNLALVTSGGARAQGAPDDQGFYAYGRAQRAPSRGIIAPRGPPERSFTGQQKDFGSGRIDVDTPRVEPQADS